MKQILFSVFAALCISMSAFADDALEYYGEGVKLYWEGKGAEAIPYLEKSLGLGFTDAAYIIGECYTWGIGIDKNYAKAQSYYKIAANSNSSDAQYRSDAQFALFILYQMNVSTLTEQEAAGYLLAAANSGIADALYELGRYYKHHAKFGMANKAMTEAAEKGSVAAMSLLGIAWYEGNGLWTGDTKNYAKAFSYLSQAAEEIEEAPIIDKVKGATFLTLSKCYRFGRGVKANRAKADGYMRKAAKYGDPDALNIEKIMNLDFR